MAMTLKPKTYEIPELVFAHDRTAFIVEAKNETPPLEIYVDEHSAKTEKGWAYIKGPETVRIPVTPGKHVLALYGAGRMWPDEPDGSFGYAANFPETSVEPVEEPTEEPAPEPTEEPAEEPITEPVEEPAGSEEITITLDKQAVLAAVAVLEALVDALKSWMEG